MDEMTCTGDMVNNCEWDMAGSVCNDAPALTGCAANLDEMSCTGVMGCEWDMAGSVCMDAAPATVMCDALLD